jgi:hypothetical protein
MVAVLLKWRPALASKVDINKSSPLHFAASDGDCSIIEVLLTHSSPSTVYLQDSDGISALHAASLMGHVGAVRLLLRLYPACADIRDNQGRSFLHAAAIKGRSTIISYATKNKMLEHLLNKQDREGNTPLHLAVVAKEHKVISKLLASKKVHSHIMNNNGKTPADLIEDSTGFYSMVIIASILHYGMSYLAIIFLQCQEFVVYLKSISVCTSCRCSGAERAMLSSSSNKILTVRFV